MTHPTQVFLSNPQALRVEYRLDDARLILWWSPLAGASTDCADRNFSSRDAHLEVFREISLPGCDLAEFVRCTYDPYHTVLHFREQVLHIALRPDAAAVLVWAESPLAVDFQTHRDDEATRMDSAVWLCRHTESGRSFTFAAAMGAGDGCLRHSHLHAPGNSRFARAELAAGQHLVIGVALSEDTVSADRIIALADLPPETHLAQTDALLAPHEATGVIDAPAHPELVALRRIVVRGLHSMIDESGAYRASLKAIYYLIWIRDSSFSLAGQTAAGWPHKLPELCRLLLDNPLTLQDEAGLPDGRLFGQLVNRTYGKLEEDGIFYVVWTLFNHWTQTGSLAFLTGDDTKLIEEALAWVEAVTWDEARGLYGGHFADETPTCGHRDHRWDQAIGKPIDGADFVRRDGTPVSRIYDVYLNTLLHSTYAMLGAMRQSRAHLKKAERVWPELKKLLAASDGDLPPYGELLLQNGERVLDPAWGRITSCCVWGLTLPHHLPLEDPDAMHAAVLDAIIAEPTMHWMNGIASAMAAVDTWTYPEARLLALHGRFAAEANRPGKFLPMGGAMPEKFGAPEGNLYHDIRPQGFAMGAWLGALTSLGVRRLPHGLAVRPTTAFTCIQNFLWRDHSLTFQFGPTGKGLALEIDGTTLPGTLQIPETSLGNGSHIRLISAPERPLWLRSSVALERVSVDGPVISYSFIAHGFARITFSADPGQSTLTDNAGNPLPHQGSRSASGLYMIDFTHFGPARLMV